LGRGNKELRSGVRNQGGRLIVRIILVLALLCFALLWVCFPRMQIDVTPLSFSKSLNSKQLSYRFFDPIKFIRNAFVASPKINHIQFRDLSDESLIIEKDVEFIVVRVNENKEIQSPITNYIDIQHSAKNNQITIPVHISTSTNLDECKFSLELEADTLVLSKGVEPEIFMIRVPYQLVTQGQSGCHEKLANKSVEFEIKHSMEVVDIEIDKKDQVIEFRIIETLYSGAYVEKIEFFSTSAVLLGAVDLAVYVAPNPMIYFDVGSNEVKKPIKGLPEHQKFLAQIKEHPKVKVYTVGHADYRMNDRFNLNLSKERAAFVREQLHFDRVLIHALGESCPITGPIGKCVDSPHRLCEDLRTFEDRRVEILYSFNQISLDEYINLRCQRDEAPNRVGK